MKEIKELRNLKEKFFENEDGTITALVYKEDIHYKLNGILRNINNILIDKDEYYENKYNDFKVKFYKNSNILYKIVNDDYFVEIKLKDNDSPNMFKDNEKIIFENVLNNIDLNYKVISKKLKEEIILKENTNIDKLEFIINTNLNVELSDNRLYFKDNEKIIFNITVPFMYDSKNEMNYNVHYEINKDFDNLILSLVLDKEWLKNESTIYPVIIDPTIVNGSGENVFDTFISSSSPSDTNGTYFRTKIGKDNNSIYRTLMNFELPTIGAGFSIVSASAVFNLSAPPSLTSEDIICIHKINTSWNEYTATWNSMNDKYDERVEAYFLPSENSDLNVNIDITDLVKEWYSGTTNNGVMLKLSEEESADEVYTFYSKESDIDSDEATRPYLLITYKNQTGINSYMTYTDITHKDGMSNINNLNGNLTSNFDLNKTVSGKFPVNLSLYYNSTDSIIDNYTNISKGWKFNLLETIEEVTINDTPYLLFIESSGAVHYMYKDTEDTYVDEDGLNLTARLINNSYEIIDIYSNKKIFNKMNNKYFLIKVIDTESNEINLNLVDGKLTKIIDANNSEININYTENLITITSDYTVSKIHINNNLITSIETINGTTSFLYDSNNLIIKITDDNGLCKTFEYYNSNPFKVKKVTEYGLNDEVGKHLLFSYEGNMTIISDDTGKKIIHSFNNNGNTIVTRLHTSNETFKDAYVVEDNYMDTIFNGYEKYKNKLLSSSPSSKYVNNLLLNSSFEKAIDNSNFDVVNGSIVNNSPNTGNRSLEITSGFELIYNITKEDDYTISFYLINNESVDFKLLKEINNVSSEIDIINIEANNEYKRYFLTGHFEENTKLILKYNSTCISHIDDLQLETGKVMNERNMISNSCFEDGLTDWSIGGNAEIVTLSTGEKALKVSNIPHESNTISTDLNISGKQGEMYKLSFWFKNEGTTKYVNASEIEGTIVSLGLYGDNPGEVTYNYLESNKTEWQYYSTYVTATSDFNLAKFFIIFERQANDFYITDIMVTKDPRLTHFDYDENGNIITMTDLSNKTNSFKYDSNNQLISSFNPMGKNFKYEYDNLKYERLIKGISPTGISNEIKYDNFGNPIKTIINNVNKNGEIINEKLYYIRSKGTKKYLTSALKFLEDDCNREAFKLIKEGNFYSIKLGNKSLTIDDSKVYLSDDNNSLFLIKLNDNGSYSIVKSSDLMVCLSIKNNELAINDRNDEDSANQFYLEEIDNALYMETTSSYTDDGKFIKSSTDTLGNTVNYDFNTNNGLLNEVTLSNGSKVIYIYDNKERVISIKQNDISVDYEYSNDLLSKIICDNKSYSYTYDNFLNNKEIFVNNNKLITFNYELNNGNLLNKIYANNNQISYSYDNLNRVSNVVKGSKIYEYLYNSNGLISKVLSSNEKYVYNYDLAKRLSTIIYNNFKVDFTYNANNTITKKKYKLDNLEYTIEYAYNDDESLIKANIDNISINYEYDYLGRIKDSNINGKLNNEYTYFTNGNKTSLILKSIKVDKDTYNYEYDSLYNITKIYLNGKIINEYSYNNDNELIFEINSLLNIKYKYIYDNNGNILSKLEYNLDDVLLNSYKYEYADNSWKDKLTKFNQESITYDEIGNPISIGNKILTWVNGRELSSYRDNDLIVNYEYDVNSIRTSKKVNGVETKYYTEGSYIILEKTGNDVIYYIRDSLSNLVGFVYNNVTYYYKKNYQGDIIGIYNSNYELIVKYTYDSYGKLLSITDGSDNLITNISHIGYINPFRYRGYYYDNETKLYYLNSRYYNPLWGRFINADTYISTNTGHLGYNMFIYCNNNPIVNIDKNGKWLKRNFDIERAFRDIYGFILDRTKLNAKNKIKAQQVDKAKYKDATQMFDSKLRESEKELKKETSNMKPVAKMFYFATVVGNKGKYNLKNKPGWMGETFLYRGRVMTAEDFGNYHYGYIGRSMGYSESLLLMGAGANHIVGHGFNFYCITYTFCDEPKDSYYIRKGIIEYDATH